MMATEKNVGRLIGLMMLLQAIAGALSNFILVGPVFAAPGFLVNAAAHPVELTLSALVGLAAGALSVAIAIAAMPVFRQYSHAIATWIVALAVVGFSLVAVENLFKFPMLALSEAYALAGSTDSGLFKTFGAVVASTRNAAHYINLIVGGGMVFVFFAALYRLALVPRALAAIGMVASLLQFIAVTMPLFGRPIIFLLLAPLGLSYLATAVWLMAKGFPARSPGDAP